MMLRRLSIAVIAVLLLGASQPPVSSSGNGQKQPNAKSSTTTLASECDKHGSDQFPVAVKILGSQKSETDSAAETKKHEREATFKWWDIASTVAVAAFTGILAISTILLWLDTRRLRKRADKQSVDMDKSIAVANKAADAAALSAKSLINVERPWLVIQFAQDSKEPGRFIFSCINQGRTPAKVISISAEHKFVADPSRLPTPPIYDSPAIAPKLTLIVHRDSFPINHGIDPTKEALRADKHQGVQNGQQFLMYYGNIIYRDTFFPNDADQGLHETRWCFVYSGGSNPTFKRNGPAEYDHYT